MIKYPDPSGYFYIGEQLKFNDGVYTVVRLEDGYAILENIE